MPINTISGPRVLSGVAAARPVETVAVSSALSASVRAVRDETLGSGRLYAGSHDQGAALQRATAAVGPEIARRIAGGSSFSAQLIVGSDAQGNQFLLRNTKDRSIGSPCPVVGVVVASDGTVVPVTGKVTNSKGLRVFALLGQARPLDLQPDSRSFASGDVRGVLNALDELFLAAGS